MLKDITANWKTTVAGVGVIALAALGMVGVHVPGVSPMDLGQALVVGGGLIFAKDVAK
jgi:hypothetical protein